MTIIYNNFQLKPEEETLPFTVFIGNSLHFDKNDIERAKAELSHPERNRASKFVKEIDASTYVLTHFFLRKMLALKTKSGYGKIKIVTDKINKPYCIPKIFDFNISHSNNYFAIGIGDKSGTLVGIDIEVFSDRVDYVEISNQYFHNREKAYILDSSESSHTQVSKFYQVWTRKEAFLKMIGIGLIDNLKVLDMASQKSIIDIHKLGNDLPNTESAYVQTFVKNEYVLSLSTNEYCIIEIKTIESL